MGHEVVVEIDAPARRVWQVWSDVAAWPDWNSTVTAVKRLDDGELGVGSRVRIRQPQLPAAIWEVTEWQPRRRWAWVSRQPGTTTTGVHLVEDLGQGRCRVTASASHTGALGGLVRAVLGGLSVRLVARETADLKRRCEEGPGRPPRRSPDGMRH